MTTQILSNFVAPALETLEPTKVMDTITVHYEDGETEKLGVTAAEIDLTDAAFVVLPGKLFTGEEFVDSLFVLEADIEVGVLG